MLTKTFNTNTTKKKKIKDDEENRKKKTNKSKTTTTTTIAMTIIRTTKTRRIFDEKNISIVAIAFFQMRKTTRKTSKNDCDFERFEK